MQAMELEGQVWKWAQGSNSRPQLVGPWSACSQPPIFICLPDDVLVVVMELYDPCLAIICSSGAEQASSGAQPSFPFHGALKSIHKRLIFLLPFIYKR